MNEYLFIFGRTPELSFIELRSRVPQAVKFDQNCAIVATDNTQLIDEAINLGGVVKIIRIIKSIPEISSDILLPLFPEQKRINFSIGRINSQVNISRIIFNEIKDKLTDLGIATRFILPKDQTHTSSVVYTRNDLFELIIFKKDNQLWIGQTMKVQDYMLWQNFDYGHPESDSRSGMLPPKVARAIVNISLGYKSDSKTLLDPFCGMGTILSQALLTGIPSVYGSDLSKVAVDKCDSNLKWLVNTYKIPGKYNLKETDATWVSNSFKDISFDLIVAEPFMGSRHLGEHRISPIELKNIIKGLQKLYIGCLRDWHKVLNNDGIVCMAIPSSYLNNRVIFVKNVVDTCETLGYTKLLGPIEYARPQAVVRRNFYWFKKII